jgi:hypothetical protein
VTASQGAPASKPVPLNGPATILASGLNMVAGAIDYTGGLLKQIDPWEALSGLCALVFVYQCSAWFVRRREQLASRRSEEPDPDDPRP